MIPDLVALMAAGLLMVFADVLWWPRFLWPGALTFAAAKVLLGKAWT